MNKNYFEIIRPGINTTFQDKGRPNLYHLGIPFSGAMDNRNYLLANKLVENDLNDPVLEFAYQHGMKSCNADQSTTLHLYCCGQLKSHFVTLRQEYLDMSGVPFSLTMNLNCSQLESKLSDP